MMARYFLILLSGVLFFPGLLVAQAPSDLPPEVAKYGYADTVFFNAKVASMDDWSTSTKIGNVYQGIAVKGEHIVKLGTSAEVRALADRIAFPRMFFFKDVLMF